MAATTLARLQSILPSLTDAEQRVATSIIENPVDVRAWSGRDLAKKSLTTETSVFRLAHKLGFDGFKDLKLSLLEEQVAERTRDEMGIFNIPIHNNAPVELQAQDVLQAYVDSLRRTVGLIDPDRLREVARLLREAKLVTLIGMGSSLSAAGLAENIFTRCGISCRLAPDSHMQLLQMLRTQDQHVVLAFSYSGETEETVNMLKVARQHGARTIAVTAFAHSSITRHAEVLLMVPVVNLPLYRVGLVDAVLPYLMLIDLLAIQITAPNTDQAAQLRDEVEQLVRTRKLRDSLNLTTLSNAAMAVHDVDSEDRGDA